MHYFLKFVKFLVRFKPKVFIRVLVRDDMQVATHKGSRFLVSIASPSYCPLTVILNCFRIS